MNNIIDFDYGVNFNSELFMEYVWVKFAKLLYMNNVNLIYLDLRNVKFIVPILLPKICCLGLIAKRNDKKLELLIDANSAVKDYLCQVGFFDIVKKYNILYVDEGLTGGEIKNNKLTCAFLCFDRKDLITKYERMYEFRKGLSEKEKLKLCVRMEVMGENYQQEYFEKKSKILSVLRSFSNDEEKILEIASGYVEIIHNTLWHGKTNCFFALQAGTYKTGYQDHFVRIDVSIMDGGKGLYESFSNKNWEKENKTTKTLELDKFLSLNSEKAKNFYSTLEMILYRKDEEQRGVYDVMVPLIDKKKLKVLFFNRNMQLTLNNDNLIKVLDGEKQLKTCVEWKENIDIGFGMDVSFSI